MKRVISLLLLPVLLAVFLLPAPFAFGAQEEPLPPETTRAPLASDETADSASAADETVFVPWSETEQPDESTFADSTATAAEDPSEPVMPPEFSDSQTSSESTTTTQPDHPPEPVTPPSEPVEPPEPMDPPEPPAPAALHLSQTSVICGVGETLTLTATNDAGAPVPVNYTVNDPQLLSQPQPGSFAACAPGAALITATATDGGSASCVVTILCAPTEILLKNDTFTLGIGESCTVVADVPANSYTSALRYSSDNPHILACTGGNTFRARHSGTATVTVSAHNGVQAQCTVTVMKAPKRLSLNETELTLGVGESVRLTPVLPPDTFSSDLRFSAGKKTVTVSKSGKVTAQKRGRTTVTVTAHNGVSAACSITVLKAPKSIRFPATLTLNPGDSYTFEPTLKKGYGAHSFKLRSSNKKVLRQSEGATFTARRVGAATVTVTAYNGVSAECEVNVLRLPQKISFAQSSFSLQIGKRFTPLITLPENTYCPSYTFTSSDPYVASVDETGAVWCRSIGTAVIRAETPNGKTAACTVSVSAMAVPSVSQLPYYPTGCEAASCTALLRYYGYNITLSQMVATIPRQNIVYKNGKRYGPDINKKFVGNPAGTYTSSTPGYGAFSPCIKKSLQKAIDDRGGDHRAKRISGCTFEELLEQISNGRPAIVWATYQMLVPHSVNSWYIPQEDGTARYFQYPRGTHVFVLKGYSRNYVTVMDPYGGYSRTYNRSTFEARWNLLGKQAVVLI